MSSAIPATMKALRQFGPVPETALTDSAEISKYVELVEVPVPQPGSGQVLVKVNRGSMNPNDLYHIQGVYSSTVDYPYPRGMGFEGAGVVVANGGGLLGQLRMGKRVALYNKNGMFAEYVLAEAAKVIPLPDNVSFEDAASSVANPVTGIGMASLVRESGSKYFFITAAAGAVARNTMRVAHSYGLKSIAIVRRDEQAEACRQENASYILNQTAQDFEAQLANLCTEVNCRYGFDCIGGDMPLTLMRALPQGSTLCMYGYFDTGPVKFEPQRLFNNWHLEFFETEYYVNSLSLVSRYKLLREVVSNMNGLFKPKVQRQFPLSEAIKAYVFYSQNMTGGKVQIVADPFLKEKQ